MDLKSAIKGTPNYRDLLLNAVNIGLQQQIRYKPQVLPTEQREFSFLVSSMGKVGFRVRECEVVRLEPGFYVEIVLPFEEMKLRYANVIVFRDFVVFCWSDAMEINYEWCQLEVSRNALLDIWESDEP